MPEDLDALRRLRSTLARVARRYPHLVDPEARGPENVDGWERTLAEDDDVAQTKQVAFRLPEDLVEDLDDLAQRMTARTGVRTNRTDVARLLLTMGRDVVQTVEERSDLDPNPSTIRDLVSLALDAVDAAREERDDTGG